MKINLKYTKKIEAAINAAEGRATSFTMFPERIPEAARYADKKLAELRIPKSLWIGTRVYIYPALPAHAYKWRPSGTDATIERCASGWFLVNIARCETSTYPGGKPAGARMVITAQAQQAIPAGWTLYTI